MEAAATNAGPGAGAADGTPLIELRDLEVHYTARRQVSRAVDGVSLDWRPGEVLGIVGESGCGKSTLARTVMGLQQPAGGEVLLSGESIIGRSELHGLRRRVQMIFQDPYQTLNPRQRVRTIVAEPLVVQGIDKSEHEERVARALSDVGLEPDRHAERFPHQLSGGQRQRVAIAAALVLEPEGLICDEPVSMLDTSVRAQVLRVLIGLREKRGLALIFITHDLSLAWSLCDRIAVMYLGRVIEQGEAAAVIERPEHPYTRALVDAVPVAVPGGGGRRDLLKGEIPDPTDIPPGCRFHPRCPKRFDACDKRDPPLFGVEQPDETEPRRVACLLYEGEAVKTQTTEAPE